MAASYLPAYLDQEFPHPKRHAIHQLYEQRVMDAIRMFTCGASQQEVREKHGGCVLDDAMFRWSEYWRKFKFNSEGHVRSH